MILVFCPVEMLLEQIQCKFSPIIGQRDIGSVRDKKLNCGKKSFYTIAIYNQQHERCSALVVLGVYIGFVGKEFFCKRKFLFMTE